MGRSTLERREFLGMAASAVLVQAVGPAASTTSRLTSRASAGSRGPGWLPSSTLLRDVPRLLELGVVPGLALAVVDGGEVVTRGFGLAAAEGAGGAGGTTGASRGGPGSGQRVGDDTIFEAASLGKPVFAYGVLRLADRGVIRLDRPLYDYLPLPEAGDARMRRVTARHVLSQTTGLGNWRQEPGPLVPAEEPGKRFSYSGEAYFYLQRVLEKVTGVPFARLMRTEVLEPLGMTSSSWAWRPEFAPRMAAGHDGTGERFDVYADIGRAQEALAAKWGKPLEDWTCEDAARAVPEVAPQWPPLPVFMMPNAAASFLTTAADYARFLARVVAPPGSGKGLELQPATLRAMQSPQVRLNSALSWGLGWGIEEDQHGRFLWHWGANMSFRNFALAAPEQGRAVAVFTNSLNGPKVYQRVVAAATGHDHPAFLWPFL
jgi:CubicO group peptidase (beta-lactamase class C family)